MTGPETHTPRQRVEVECARRGRADLVAAMARQLSGADVDAELIVALGGPAGAAVLAGGGGGVTGYWPRVWAARGLLHVWDEEATVALVDAAHDPSWRVREMVAKVVARHRVDEALEAIDGLRADPVPRVRQAAERALRALAGDAG
ncbi:MAG: HEAT repeat domain-containing protein [Acidimicrobiales bacterium]